MSKVLRRLKDRRGRVRGLVPTTAPRRTLRNMIVALAVLGLLHVGAMVIFEGLTAFQALWLTLTTMTTVGYGDLSAETAAGRISTIVLIFLGGIWMAFQTAALYFDVRADRREQMRFGHWRWHMRDHILVLNTPRTNAKAYLTRLVCELRASRRFKTRLVQLVTCHFPAGLPPALTELGVVHTDGESWDPRALGDADATAADVIVVLAEDDSDPASDGRNLDIVDRLREMGAKGRILCECVDDANRPRLMRVGADIIVRPLRGYPEMIVRALAAPGAEKILEDLFTSRHDECWRYDVDITGWRWGDLVSHLVNKDIGVPVAFRCHDDKRISINPGPDTPVAADKLFVLVREGNARTDAEVARLLVRR